jgi:dihydroneopterin aldolase/2-amino-4-hydroxy-6-hydroxymethyldihydropteridine diphosphokinase
MTCRYTHITGVHGEEKYLGQMFNICVEVSLDLGPAAKTDDLAKSIHYGHLCRIIEDVMKTSKHDLIETWHTRS